MEPVPNTSICWSLEVGRVEDFTQLVHEGSCLVLDSCTGCSSHSHLRYCRGEGGRKGVAEEASTGGKFVPVELSLSPRMEKIES